MDTSTGAQDDSPRSVNQQRAQVRVAAFADAKVRFAAAGVLPRDQAD